MDPVVKSKLAWVGAFAGVSLIIAGAGIGWFTQSGWFNDDADEFGEFSLGQLIGLCMFTFFAPIGFTFLIVFLQTCIRGQPTKSGHRWAVAWAVIIMFIFIGLGLIWSATFFECMGVGCTGEAYLATTDLQELTDAGYGFTLSIGAAFVLMCFFLSIVFVWSCLETSSSRSRIVDPASVAETKKLIGDDSAAFDSSAAGDASSPAAGAGASSSSSSSSSGGVSSSASAGLSLGAGDAAGSSSSASSHVPQYRDRHWSRWGIWLLWTIAIFLWWIPTAMMPGSWEFWKPNRIAYNVAHESTTDTDDCGGSPPRFCAELSGATWTTYNIILSDTVILKIFPSSIIFFFSLIIVPFLALISYEIAALRRFCNRKVSCCCGRSLFSFNELSMMVLFSILTILWTTYWVRDHNFHGRASSRPAWEKVYRTFGQIAVMVMSLLMLPAARSGVVGSFFRISWEAAIQYHRWMGALWLLVVGGHIATYYIYSWHDTRSLANDWFPLHYSGSVDNFTVPLQMVVLIFALITLLAFAIWEPTRRNHFEWFYYSHHVTYTVLIITVIWHAGAAWMYLIPGTALWFFDRCLRAFRSSRAVRVRDIRAVDCGTSKVAVVTCDVAGGFTYYPGQYAFLNVAEISVLEWHPFTISSATAETVTFMVKSMGDDTWTDHFYKRAAKAQAGASGSLTLCVDGPVGEPIDFSKFRSVILVANGIGITPCASIFASLRKSATAGEVQTQVHLLWAARDRALFSLLGDELETAGTPGAAVGGAATSGTAQLFVTRAHEAGHVDEAQVSGRVASLVRPGTARPIWATELPPLAAAPNPDDGDNDAVTASKTLVFVCGFETTVNQCEHIARERGWVFHNETFEL